MARKTPVTDLVEVLKCFWFVEKFGLAAVHKELSTQLQSEQKDRLLQEMAQEGLLKPVGSTGKEYRVNTKNNTVLDLATRHNFLPGQNRVSGLVNQFAKKEENIRALHEAFGGKQKNPAPVGSNKAAEIARKIWDWGEPDQIHDIVVVDVLAQILEKRGDLFRVSRSGRNIFFTTVGQGGGDPDPPEEHVKGPDDGLDYRHLAADPAALKMVLGLILELFKGNWFKSGKLMAVLKKKTGWKKTSSQGLGKLLKSTEAPGKRYLGYKGKGSARWYHLTVNGAEFLDLTEEECRAAGIGIPADYVYGSGPVKNDAPEDKKEEKPEPAKAEEKKVVAKNQVETECVYKKAILAFEEDLLVSSSVTETIALFDAQAQGNQAVMDQLLDALIVKLRSFHS